MNSKKVLVTGADGFIGSHLVESLVRDGYSVRAFCMYNSFGNWGWLNNVDNSNLFYIRKGRSVSRCPKPRLLN